MLLYIRRMLKGCICFAALGLFGGRNGGGFFAGTVLSLTGGRDGCAGTLDAVGGRPFAEIALGLLGGLDGCAGGLDAVGGRPLTETVLGLFSGRNGGTGGLDTLEKEAMLE